MFRSSPMESPAQTEARRADAGGVARLGFGDALRGWAVLMVVATHAGVRVAERHPVWGPVFEHGARGVQLFYLLSAFMLARSIASRFPRERRPWACFFARRFFRIAPLFWLAIGFHLWAYGLGPRNSLGLLPGITWQNILATSLFLNGTNPYWINSVVFGGWSIAVEMGFYLAMPLVWRWVRGWRAALVASAACAAVAGVLHAVLTAHRPIPEEALWQDYLFFWLPNQLPVFLLGLALFWVLEKAGKGKALVPAGLARALPWLSIAAFAATALLPVPRWVRADLSAVAFLGLGVGLALAPHPLLVNRLLCRVGVVSYSVYLLHPILIGYAWGAQYRVLKTLGWSAPEWLLCVGWVVGPMVLSVLASLVTHRWIEEPGIALGRRVIRRLGWDTPPAPAPAAVAGAASRG